MRKLTRLTATSAAVVLGGALGAVAIAPAAHADLRCDWSWIVINSGPGGEAPTNARGHRHNTGNHYIMSVLGDGSYVYYADNTWGSDGDTPDTYYGTIDCF